MIAGHIIGLLGQFAIGVALIVLARLSKRLGKVTHARRYYIGNYIAAFLIVLGGVLRLYFITQGVDALRAPNQNMLYTLFSDGLSAIGITLGLIVTWYYWSWLLAERD